MSEEAQEDWREFVEKIAFYKFPEGTTLITITCDAGEVRESNFGRQVVFETDLGLWGNRNSELLKKLKELHSKIGTLKGTEVEVTRFGTGRSSRYKYQITKKPTKPKK